MTLAPRTKLGPYEIAPTGAGQRLGRIVAIWRVKEQHRETRAESG
jgi:hypothetical protein